MAKYYVTFTAYKRSGKLYNSHTIYLGEFKNYPESDIYRTIHDITDLDAVTGLKDGSIEANNFIVGYIVTDNTEEPICLSGLIRV